MTEDPRSPDTFTAESPFTLPGFFDAMADDRLVAAVCESCGTALIPPRPACYDCGSRSVRIEEQPPHGTIVSHTAVHRPPTPFESLAPITVAIVELESGARLTGRVTANHDAVSIGDPVEFAVRAPSEVPISTADLLSYEADWPFHVFEPTA